MITDDVAAITAEVEDAEGAGRQQDHRADPCRLPARHRGDRQDPGCRRRGRRPFAHAAVEHRPEGGWPLPDDGRQPRRLQGAGRTRPPPTASISATSSSTSTTRASSRRPRAIRSCSMPPSRRIPTMTARIAELAKPIDELRSKVIGETEAPIEGAREVCRVAGMLDGQSRRRRHARPGQGTRASPSPSRTAAACAPRSTAATSRMGEVLTVLPFQNTLATFQLTGADIIAALENGLGQIEEGAGRFPQVAGLHFTYRQVEAGRQPGRLGRGEGRRQFRARSIRPRPMASSPTTTCAPAATATRSSPRTARMPTISARTSKTSSADYLAAHNPYKPYIDGRVTAVAVAAAATEGAATSQPVDKQVVPANEQPATGQPAPAAPPATEPVAQAPAATAPARLRQRRRQRRPRHAGRTDARGYADNARRRRRRHALGSRQTLLR